MNLPLILLVILLGIGVYIWSIYNRFVATKTRIKASIQEIGNQLKRQADLIPNLTEAVKGYFKQEKEIFEKITEARKVVMEAISSQEAQKLVNASEKLNQALAPIRALFESTPQLRSAEPTMKLMDELRDTADKVMYARRTLIDLTADYNVMLATFPSNLVGKLFNFKPEVGLKAPEEGEHIEVKEEELKTPKVKLE
ncbi:MAG: LemA family protein [Microgenomates group bacterium]